jgi:anti-repressor protein
MTHELIKISTDTAGRSAVSGRELHEFLKIDTRYNDWFNRMVAYGFVENQDFEVLLKNEQNPQGGRPSSDHAISLDMAKEICMIQRSDKGKEARLYFIECERKLTASKPTGLALVKEAMDFLISENETLKISNAEKQAQIEADRPKVEFANQIGDCADGVSIREFGLVFRQNGAGFGQDGFVARLLQDHFVYRDRRKKLRPYAEYVESGLFWEKATLISSSSGNFQTFQVKVTGKGQKHFFQKYLPQSILPAEAGGVISITNYHGDGDDVEIAQGDFQ